MQIKEVTRPQNLSRSKVDLPVNEPGEPDKNKKRCLYMREEECTIPDTPFTLCKTCPYGYIHCLKAVVKNIYKKIVGIAIFFKNIEHPRR
ncbi:MAG: hypothetical protein WC527_02610 [Candidatus Margulisiibacteriota bacterium]